jgi:hypothetical protein
MNRVNILESAVLMTFRVRGIGNSRKMDSDKVRSDADSDMLNVSKKLLDSPEFRAIQNHRDNFRYGYLMRRMLPSAVSGTATFVVPLALVPDIEARWAEFLERDRALIDEFCRVYPAQVEAVKGKLKSEFNPADYPPVAKVRAAFSVDLSYMTIGTPESLKKVSGALHARQVEKFYANLDDTARRIDEFLGENLADLVDWLVERLSDSADGKQKSFGKPFESKLEKVQDFLTTFKDRNLTGNERLQVLVEKSKALLKGVNAESVKGDGNFRKRVRERFAEVKVQLAKMVVDRPTRRIVLDD